MGDEDGGLTFPNEPRSELDRALTEVLRSAEKVMETQGRLRALLAASRSVSEGLELPDLLRRIALSETFYRITPPEAAAKAPTVASAETK